MHAKTANGKDKAGSRVLRTETMDLSDAMSAEQTVGERYFRSCERRAQQRDGQDGRLTWSGRS